MIDSKWATLKSPRLRSEYERRAHLHPYEAAQFQCRFSLEVLQLPKLLLIRCSTFEHGLALAETVTVFLVRLRFVGQSVARSVGSTSCTQHSQQQRRTRKTPAREYSIPGKMNQKGKGLRKCDEEAECPHQDSACERESGNRLGKSCPFFQRHACLFGF